MLTISQGKDLRPAIGDLDSGECFLYDACHWRKICQKSDLVECYNFTRNHTKDLRAGERVTRMPLFLSEVKPTKEIYFVGCHENVEPKAKFVVDFCTVKRQDAIDYCDKQDQRKNTWCVFEAEVGDNFSHWDQIHVAARGTD